MLQPNELIPFYDFSLLKGSANRVLKSGSFAKPGSLFFMRFALVALLLSLLVTLVFYSIPRTWELNLITDLQQNGTPALTLFLQLVSDTISFFSLGITAALLLAGFIKKERTLKIKALITLLAIALGGSISYAVKKTVSEPRPYEIDGRIHQWSGGGGYGFPSGHTVEAVAAATCFSLLWPGWATLVASSLWAFVIMFSRVYLGVHDPGDISAGIFIGILSSLIMIKAWEKFGGFTAPTLSE
jgi:membrane-associated phospholipid phosphatase